jgi:hypothetical protein
MLVVEDGHSDGVPAMHKQFTESDRAVLAQLLALKVSKAQIAAAAEEASLRDLPRAGAE